MQTSSVAAKIRIIIDNTNLLARKISQKWNSLTYLYLIMLNRDLKSYFTGKTKWFPRKSVTFVTSIPIPKAPMGKGWADIHMVKGVFVRFGFDDR